MGNETELDIKGKHCHCVVFVGFHFPAISSERFGTGITALNLMLFFLLVFFFGNVAGGNQMGWKTVLMKTTEESSGGHADYDLNTFTELEVVLFQ